MTLIDDIAGVTFELKTLKHEVALDAHRVRVANDDLAFFQTLQQRRLAGFSELQARQGALVLRLLTDGRSHAKALRVIRALKL